MIYLIKRNTYVIQDQKLKVISFIFLELDKKPRNVECYKNEEQNLKNKALRKIQSLQLVVESSFNPLYNREKKIDARQSEILYCTCQFKN